MRQTTVSCDLCGRVIKADLSHLDPRAGVARERFPEGVDACPSCLDALGEWIAARRQAQDAPGRDDRSDA